MKIELIVGNTPYDLRYNINHWLDKYSGMELIETNIIFDSLNNRWFAFLTMTIIGE